MRTSIPLALVALWLAGCGGGGESKPAAAPAPAVVEKPAEESRRFPMADRVEARVENDKLLGKAFLPGGNVASYKKGKQEYQLFLVKAKNTSDPAIWLLDWKKEMKDAKLVPGFGGYYGDDGGKKVFVFTKNSYLAGVVGLSEKDADAVARVLAVRIP
ncbi:MAG: hypothetical protein ABI693_33180 [Bryobacteraceae bacterium]